MNKLFIIGNLTRRPEMKQTPDGVAVCNFTVAVSRRVKKGAHPEADYVRVSAWRQLGESCYQYLDKGRKVCVVGAARSYAYNGKDGSVCSYMEISDAENVEFLTPKGAAAPDDPDGDDLPAAFAD